MVLLAPQVHLQKEVGARGRGDFSISSRWVRRGGE